jgi:hypothetical protein
MRSKFLILSVSLLAGFTACKREVLDLLPTKSTENTANIKIVHASAYNTNYSVQLKVNDTRVTNAFTYSTPFPGGGLNTGGSNMPWYFSFNPGSTKIAMSVPKVGMSIDSIALFTGTVNIDANKYYTVYLADTLAKTQMVVLEEDKTLPANNTSRFRFVNLIPNLAAVDLYFAGSLVAGNIAFKGASPTFIIPYGTSGQWAIRPAGSAATTTAIAVYPAGTAVQSIPNQRIMSVYARGYSGATGNRIPAISLLYN